ncbi:uncharacterized protein LY79DRAFT_579287 [Colletotrichum navitas]|uniref:Uncharacterized protein n=1 Tax=Colletotrichum navitas TaxID=681940 RepID=A0AAD8Q196_9PEZI|nr:uncharacterized protein LY79DRAFT_579287 [Colletotrichum navitas]KAK1593456.1 hypothetical protein LY79DRAFT_579287 [Colletotrichum navitas]
MKIWSFGDDGDLGGVGSNSSSSSSSSSSAVGWLAKKLQSLWGETPRETEDGQSRTNSRPGQWEKGGKQVEQPVFLCSACPALQRLWRGAALSSAPMRRMLGMREHAWQETIAGMARQRGKQLMMGGERQGTHQRKGSRQTQMKIQHSWRAMYGGGVPSQP